MSKIDPIPKTHVSTKAQRKEAALVALERGDFPTVGKVGFDDANRGLLVLDHRDAEAPCHMRFQQRMLLGLTDRETCTGKTPVSTELVRDIVACLDSLPTKAEAREHYPDLKTADDRDYAEFYEAEDLPWMLVHAVNIAANDNYSAVAEPIIRAVAKVVAQHKLPASTRQHIGCVIDCWCQATGIDVENPTGCWEIVTGAKQKGWKNPRTERP